MSALIWENPATASDAAISSIGLLWASARSFRWCRELRPVERAVAPWCHPLPVAHMVCRANRLHTLVPSRVTVGVNVAVLLALDLSVGAVSGGQTEVVGLALFPIARR